MRTRCEIATISYNSETFLKDKLSELVRNHKISDFMYIFHDHERDETKDHFHLYIKPNGQLDTMDLQVFFREIDLDNPNKPLGVIDFRPCRSVDDWILYSQHYGPYLASKCESREFTYTKEDFKYNDLLTFEDKYNHAFKGSDWAHRYQILQQLSSGDLDPSTLILNGTIPFNQASSLNAFLFMKNKYGKLDRGGRPGHEDLDEICKGLALDNVDYEGIEYNLSEKDSFRDVIYRINR